MLFFAICSICCFHGDISDKILIIAVFFKCVIITHLIMCNACLIQRQRLGIFIYLGGVEFNYKVNKTREQITKGKSPYKVGFLSS